MDPRERPDWRDTLGEGRIDLARLFPEVRPQGWPGVPKRSIAESVLHGLTDEETASTVEALASAIRPAPRARRPRRLRTMAILKIIGTTAAVTFTVLAVQWEWRRWPER